MNNIKKIGGQRENVVFDIVLSTYPGGVLVDNVDAKARFTDGIIPAGTIIVITAPNKGKVVNADLTATNIKGAAGLVQKSVAIEDYTQVSVVTDGTFRTVALPDKEKAGVALILKEVPTLKGW